MDVLGFHDMRQYFLAQEFAHRILPDVNAFANTQETIHAQTMYNMGVHAIIGSPNRFDLLSVGKQIVNANKNLVSLLAKQKRDLKTDVVAAQNKPDLKTPLTSILTGGKKVKRLKGGNRHPPPSTSSSSRKSRDSFDSLSSSSQQEREYQKLGKLGKKKTKSSSFPKNSYPPVLPLPGLPLSRDLKKTVQRKKPALPLLELESELNRWAENL